MFLLTELGIRERPYKPWDGFAGVSSNLETGYYTHSSTLFLTWHRPYLALFEGSSELLLWSVGNLI